MQCSPNNVYSARGTRKHRVFTQRILAAANRRLLPMGRMTRGQKDEWAGAAKGRAEERIEQLPSKQTWKSNWGCPARPRSSRGAAVFILGCEDFPFNPLIKLSLMRESLRLRFLDPETPIAILLSLVKTKLFGYVEDFNAFQNAMIPSKWLSARESGSARTSINERKTKSSFF